MDRKEWVELMKREGDTLTQLASHFLLCFCFLFCIFFITFPFVWVFLTSAR